MLATPLLGTATLFCGYMAWKEDEPSSQGVYIAETVILGIGTLAVAVGSCWQKTYPKISFDCGGGKTVPLYQHQNVIQLTGLSDIHLKQLKQFPKLKKLYLTDCEKLTREGLLALEACPKLTFLEIKGSPEIGKWGTEAIPPSLIKKMVANYDRPVSTFLGNIPPPKVRIFGVVYHREDYFPFIHKINQRRLGVFLFNKPL